MGARRGARISLRCQLGGWQGENEPALPGIDRQELERVAEEGANPVGVPGEYHPVDPGDQGFGSLVTGRPGDLAIQESCAWCPLSSQPPVLTSS
jgi:hypothetical protein